MVTRFRLGVFPFCPLVELFIWNNPWSLLYYEGQFHPYLDIYQKVFELETLERLSQATGASILRFQDISLNYDPFNIYISATILGRPPFLSKCQFVFTLKLIEVLHAWRLFLRNCLCIMFFLYFLLDFYGCNMQISKSELFIVVEMI